MTFLAIFFALLIEQVRPLGAHSAVHQLARLWVAQILRSVDAGKVSTARLAWVLIVLVPALLSTVVHHALQAGGNWLTWALLFALHVAVLYVTLGFRQFSAYFSAVRDAVDAGDVAGAQAQLAKWSLLTPTSGAQQRSDIVRCTLAQASASAHVHVFGVMLAYGIGALLGLGPAGALAYRLCELLARSCNRQQLPQASLALSEAGSVVGAHAAQHPISSPMLSLAQQAWRWLDWLPARSTALLFAIVGNFEDAVACWRAQSQTAQASGRYDNAAIVMSAAVGAIGVQMGSGSEAYGAGSLQLPQPGHLQAMVGLVWRAVVVAMTLLAVLTLAGLP